MLISQKVARQNCCCGGIPAPDCATPPTSPGPCVCWCTHPDTKMEVTSWPDWFAVNITSLVPNEVKTHSNGDPWPVITIEPAFFCQFRYSGADFLGSDNNIWAILYQVYRQGAIWIFQQTFWHRPNNGILHPAAPSDELSHTTFRGTYTFQANVVALWQETAGNDNYGGSYTTDVNDGMGGHTDSISYAITDWEGCCKAALWQQAWDHKSETWGPVTQISQKCVQEADFEILVNSSTGWTRCVCVGSLPSPQCKCCYQIWTGSCDGSDPPEPAPLTDPPEDCTKPVTGCGPCIEGMVTAICWDAIDYHNPFGPYGDVAWCDYKTIPVGSCTGGTEPGRAYTCVEGVWFFIGITDCTGGDVGDSLGSTPQPGRCCDDTE